MYYPRTGYDAKVIEIEKYLLGMLNDLRKAYEKEAEPIYKKLIEIQHLKSPVFFVDTKGNVMVPPQ